MPVWAKVMWQAIGAVSTVYACATFVAPSVENIALEARRRVIDGTVVFVRHLHDANHEEQGSSRTAMPFVSFDPQFQRGTISYDLPEQFALASTKTAYSSTATAIYNYGDVIPQA